MGTNLKDKAVSGFAWRFSERLLAQGVSFVVSLVLARLLAPDDYGVIALITVFISIANIFITDGFCAALIQKKNTDALDFSSVFFGGFIISIFLYILIFIASPFVAEFYNLPILSPVLRVLALRIPLASINAVENAYLSKRLEFKKFFWATFGGTVGSAVAGIVAAYNGAGVWALVIQNLFNYTVDTIVLAIVIKRMPLLKFSFRRMLVLLNYGYKILLTNILFTLVDQLRTLIIGKFYSTNQLAFYSKGKHFPQLLATNITSPLSSVLFPVMSVAQENKAHVREIMRKSIRVISYVVTPFLLGFAAVSESFVSLVLTEKWLPCVPYIWIGCVYYIFTPINSVNLEAVKSIGKSDQVLKYGFIKRLVSVISLIVAVPFGVMYIALSLIVSVLICSIINAYQNKKLFDYLYKDQFFDIFTNVSIAGCMCIIVAYVGNISVFNDLLTMLIQFVAGGVVYAALSVLTMNKTMTFCVDYVKTKIKK